MRGNYPMPNETEDAIVYLLFYGMPRKDVARFCNVSISTVAKTKARWPLLFWNTLRRYQKFARKF